MRGKKPQPSGVWLGLMKRMRSNAVGLGRQLIAVCVLFSALPESVRAVQVPANFVLAQEAALRSDFARAESLAVVMKREQPADPTGDYAMAAIEQMRLFGCEGTMSPAELKRRVQIAVRAGREQVARRPEAIWPRYVFGLSLGLSAVIAADEGSYWHAYRAGTESVEQLEEVLRREPGFSDALLALGAYHYWRGAAMRNWTWLPFIADTRSQGIREMKRAWREGATTQNTAPGMIVWALLKDADYHEALAISSEIAARYPANRAFVTARADALFGLRRWEEAAAAYTQAVGLYSADQFRCPGSVEARAKRGIALAEMGKCSDALPDLRAAVLSPAHVGYGRDFKATKNRARVLLERCLEKGP